MSVEVAAVEVAKNCHWNKLVAVAVAGHSSLVPDEVPTEHSHMLVTVAG